MPLQPDLELLEQIVPALDRSSASLALLEAAYFDHVRRRSFRTTPLHSRQAFERAMGLYFGAVLVAEGRARWLAGEEGVTEVGGERAIANLSLLCRDWHKAPDNARHDLLARRLAKPWPAAPLAERRSPPASGTASPPRKPSRKPLPRVVPPSSLKEARALLDPILEASTQPYVRIVGRSARGALPLWASKACDGRPYLPRGTAWPEVAGRRLLPVLQIDFSEVPRLAGFPRKGLLSVFWSEDMVDSRVLYFPSVRRDESQLLTDFPDLESGPTLEPFGRPTRLAFEEREGCVSWADVHFEQLLGGARVLDALDDSPAYDAIWNHVWKRSGAGDSRLGGYASPEQDDPRKTRRGRAYDRHLLQIQNDNFVHNYFIGSAALARGDFADVLYHHACD